MLAEFILLGLAVFALTKTLFWMIIQIRETNARKKNKQNREKYYMDFLKLFRNGTDKKNNREDSGQDK